MPQGRRKQPFSQKQKKIQLQVCLNSTTGMPKNSMSVCAYWKFQRNSWLKKLQVMESDCIALSPAQYLRKLSEQKFKQMKKTIIERFKE